MNAQKRGNKSDRGDKLYPAEPATPSTPGNPNDPRWKAADNLENDNEEKLGEKPDPKRDKTGG